MIDLSIIIPHFNSVGLLKNLLGSIPVCDNVQVIVVDDNSTKDAELLGQVIQNDGRCEFFKNHTGKNSAGTCRNIGLTHATGKWVMFADADDYFTDSFYETVSGYFDSDVDIVYFPPTSIILETGKKSNRHVLSAELVKQYIKRGEKRLRGRRCENSLKYRFCGPVSKMYKMELIKRHGIEFESRLVGNDIAFCTEYALQASAIEASNEVIYCITKGNETLTTKMDDASFYNRIDLHVLRHKLLKEKLSDKEIQQLGIFSADFLLMALKGFGMKRMMETARVFRENKIRLFNLSLFNLKVVWKQIVS